MRQEKLMIEGIPAILWGEPSECIYIHVHGKMSKKEYAESFAEIAEAKGYQTLSFDLPEHGERKGQQERCDIWNGMHDLNVVADYVFAKWKHVSLCACSLGAFFSLHSYRNRSFNKCLFQSPIVDMKWLVEHMMLWSNVTEKQLEEQKEIDTPIDVLRWDYYSWIETHPVTEWKPETFILYGALDTLQERGCLDAFCTKFNAELTVSEHSQHPFMEPEDRVITKEWLKEKI